MTDTPKKDLTALFPAPAAPQLPPELQMLSRSMARGLEIKNLPDTVDAEALITNFCAAYQAVNEYVQPLGYKFTDRNGAPAVNIVFESHVHYPTLMSVFSEVFEGELMRTGTPIPDTDGWALEVAAHEVILNPDAPRPRFSPGNYSGPRFMGH